MQTPQETGKQPQAGTQQRHPLRRPGCIIGLVIWFTVLLTPCFFIILATRGEVAIATGSAPEQQIRIWLVQEARQSGIGLSTAQVLQVNDQTCVQTHVNFILWRGEADPTQYCTCYLQDDAEWQLLSAEQGMCPSSP